MPDPAERRHHKILSVEVTGGFLRGTKLAFEDGLNCIIGGRGTGKTTVLEFVRHALGLVPDARANPQRARALGSLLQTNLAGGRVRLTVETKHGLRYAAERGLDEAAQITNEKGEPVAITLDRDLIFKADVYSQNEIEEIATSARSQLALIDKFVEEDVRRLDGEFRKLARELDQNATELIRLARESEDLAESAHDLPILEERLRALKPPPGPEARALEKAHEQKAQRERERAAFEGLVAEVRRAGSELEATITGVSRRLARRIDREQEDGINAKVLRAAFERVRELASSLEQAEAKLRQAYATTEGALLEQGKKLEEAHVKQERAYRETLARSEEDRGRAAERADLERRHLAAAAARKEQEVRANERRLAEEKRRDLLARLSALRDERFAVRKAVADRLTRALEPMIRVSVTQGESRDGYRELLTEALKGSGLKYAQLVERLVLSTTPDEFAALVGRNEPERLAERAGLDPTRAKKAIEIFRDPGLLYRIETVEIDDLPRIELLDGKAYKDSPNLSTGQKCTTILPLLLLESERPLLIDQPEDNLDNAFIYQTIVRNLRGAKGLRQLIFVTHNPNIPVLGDAERVFVMHSDGRQATLEGSGTVDEIKESIETLLEGGREAFLLRKARYGH